MDTLAILHTNQAIRIGANDCRTFRKSGRQFAKPQVRRELQPQCSLSKRPVLERICLGFELSARRTNPAKKPSSGCGQIVMRLTFVGARVG
jgi:hypothetical protein